MAELKTTESTEVRKSTPMLYVWEPQVQGIHEVADPKLVRVIDTVVSLIWTRRYCDFGEFTLVIPYTDEAFAQIKIGMMLSRYGDAEWMSIENVTLSSDGTNGAEITISGRSLLELFSRRVNTSSRNFVGNISIVLSTVWSANTSSDSAPFPTSGESESLIEKHQYVRAMPGVYVKQNGYSYDPQIYTSTDPLTVEFGKSISELAIEIASSRSYGIRVVRSSEYTTGRWAMEIYKGNDVSGAVVFSDDSGNVDSVNIQQDSSNYHNVAVGSSTFSAETSSEGDNDEIRCYSYSWKGGYIARSEKDTVWNQSDTTSLAFMDECPCDFARYEYSSDQSSVSSDGLTARNYANAIAKWAQLDVYNYGVNVAMDASILQIDNGYREKWDVGDYITIKSQYGIKEIARVVTVAENYDATGYKIVPTLSSEQLELPECDGMLIDSDIENYVTSASENIITVNRSESGEVTTVYYSDHTGKEIDDGVTAALNIGNGTLTVTQNGETKGTFTANQSTDTTIPLTDTTYDEATTSTAGLMSASDKSKLDSLTTYAGGSTDYGAISVADGTITLSEAVGKKYINTGGVGSGEVFNDYANNSASNHDAHAEGQYTTASGSTSHAEGYSTTASGSTSHAEGYSTTAEGGVSHAEGQGTTAHGTFSHAEGLDTSAKGYASHCEGRDTITTEECAHAEGYKTQAGGSFHAGYYSCHAEGNTTTAKNMASHSEGYYTEADGWGAHCEGSYTKALSDYQHVQGKYNVADSDKKYADIVGGGSDGDHRANIWTLDWNGNINCGKTDTDGNWITYGTINGVDITALPKSNTTYTLTQDSTDGHIITLTPSEGDATTITIPDNNNYVAQLESDDNAYHEILMSGTADSTNRTESVKKSSKAELNPSTGRIRTYGNNSGLRVDSTDGSYSTSFIVGSGGVNRGIYDYTFNKWVMYSDATSSYFAGNAETATKADTAETATKDASGNVITDTYATKAEIPTKLTQLEDPLPYQRMSAGTALEQGQDLNDVTAFGVYYSVQSSVTQSLVNVPSICTNNARLEVFASSGVNGKGTYLYQKFYSNSSHSLLAWIRTKTNDTDGWSPWHLLTGNDYTRFAYDGTDFDGKYIKVATYKITNATYYDYDAKFSVNCSIAPTGTIVSYYNGDLHLHMRRNNATSRYTSLTWENAGKNIVPSEWFVTLSETDLELTLWKKIAYRYESYNVVLESSGCRTATQGYVNKVAMRFNTKTSTYDDYDSTAYDAVVTSTLGDTMANTITLGSTQLTEAQLTKLLALID